MFFPIPFLQVPDDLSMPNPWKEPGFGNVIFVKSPNFGPRPMDAVIDTVVVHSTVSPTLQGTTKWFTTTESQVSAHFTIGKDGSIVQHVNTFDRAWHAGVSEFRGRTNLNNFTIGIELVNLNDGIDPYPVEQTTALRYLITTLKRRHELKVITSHEFIARPPGRKSDPKAYPWSTLEGIGLEIVK